MIFSSGAQNRPVFASNLNSNDDFLKRLAACRGLASEVRIVEVGPRDGLQNEKNHVSTGLKVDLVNKLTAAGCEYIEAGAFVSPKAVPRMADSKHVFQQIERSDAVTYAALTPNLKGFETAMEVQASEVAVFTAASEAFNKANIRCSIEESITRFDPVFEAARENGVKVRGYVSCIAGCPYQGWVDPAKVREVTQLLLEKGCYEVSLGDTIGVGTPGSIAAVLKEVLETVQPGSIALHLHDTYGQALANILVGLQHGIRTFDASVAGLGGCPYAPGASGNVATEDVVYMLDGLGIKTGISLDELVKVGNFISTELGRMNGSKVGRAVASSCIHE